MISLANPSTTNLISLILVAVTGAYVFLTWRISTANKDTLSSMQQQFLETIRPCIVARITIRHSVFVSLEIENVGKSPAKNARLTMDKDFYQFAEKSADKNIRMFEAFCNPIPMFTPGQKLRFDLAQGFNMGVEKDGDLLTPMVFSITAQYDFRNEHYVDVFQIDVSPLMHTHTPRSASEQLERMADNIEKLERKLNEIKQALTDHGNSPM